MVRIITDTGADLEPDVYSANEISFLPISVQLDSQTYEDRVNITPEEFYAKLGQARSTPVTSRIAPYIYEKTFTDILRKHQEIICITVSSGLSAIYEAATLAAEAIDPRRITVIDSRCVSLGQGLVVLKAANLAKKGKSRQEIVETITTSCQRMEHIVAFGSLEMLRRGGRVSNTQAFVGSVLRVTPIFQMEEGKMLPFEVVRGSRRMVQFMLEVLERRASHIEQQLIGISHANNFEMAEELASAIRERFQVADVLISEIGAAIGSHAGPKTLALFFQR